MEREQTIEGGGMGKKQGKKQTSEKPIQMIVSERDQLINATYASNWFSILNECNFCKQLVFNFDGHDLKH